VHGLALGFIGMTGKTIRALRKRAGVLDGGAWPAPRQQQKENNPWARPVFHPLPPNWNSRAHGWAMALTACDDYQATKP
jgi:hypothetical protein